MKNLFNLDNPFVQFLSRVGDLIIVNTLFLLCCVPVVTVGASAAALHKVSQAIILDEDNGTIKTFFRGFRENFRQATALWLMKDTDIPNSSPVENYLHFYDLRVPPLRQMNLQHKPPSQTPSL